MLCRFAKIAVVSSLLAGAFPMVARADDQPKSTQADSEARDGRQARMKELQKKLSALSERIKDLKENNQLDAAEALQREGGALAIELKQLVQSNTEEAKRRTIAELKARDPNFDEEAIHQQVRNEYVQTLQTEARKVRQHLEELTKAGRLDEAERAKKMLRAINEKLEDAHAGHESPAGDHREGNEDAARRAEHLRQAAEHLAAAGLADQAENLRRQASSLVAGHSDENRPSQNAELRELFTLIRRQNERIERLEQIVQKLVSGGEREEKREKDE